MKLTVPDVPGTRSLNSVASVTVKGNALYVDVWDHDVSYTSHKLGRSQIPLFKWLDRPMVQAQR